MSPDPLAIVGMACRFPGGADTPEAFWRLLMDKTDAVGPVPEARRQLWSAWGDAGTVHPPGGFLPDIDRFDPAFFHLSPRETRHIDPQQRLLLELAWETLEDAGCPAASLAGSPVGVFTGIFLDEYWDLQRYGDPAGIDAHTNTGGTLSIAANRISYAFDLRGPSLSVDTACSSSLTAVHLACQSLRNGECELALAGGVNLLLTPRTSRGFERAAMLSPDGRCKAFDARADGYGRSDGAGLILIKPLHKAVTDGDTIYAVIHGSAINQDGRTVGMTVPRSDAQAGVIRQACCQAGIDPGELFYVEAHGAGTPTGDPLEARAIGMATGAGRLCHIGSVKTAIGHTEAAAGIAGLIKTALALRNRVVPPNLHFVTPHPGIPFDALNLRVATEPLSLPGPVYAGVNSFGFGGANAHVVMASPPADNRVFAPVSTPALLPFSAHTADALKHRAASLASWLDTHALPVEQVAVASARRHGHLPHRAALLCADRASAIDALGSFPDGQDLVVGMGGIEHPPVVYVFTGMGPQWWGMGQTLYRTEPVYRAAVEQVDGLFRTCASWSILEEMLKPESASRMQETAVSQPANFVLQMGLHALLDAWGIRPALIIGHSVGEIAGACAAGLIDLETAVRLCHHRARLEQTLAGRGRMIAVGITPDEAQEAIRDFPEQVALAAINSPIAVTLSGDHTAIETLEWRFTGMGVFCRPVTVDMAFHSHQMDAIKDEFLNAVGKIDTTDSPVGMVSTVTGAPVAANEIDAGYWRRNIRDPIRFEAACAHLPDNAIVVQIGPHPVLSMALLENIAHYGKTVTALHALRRDRPERESLLDALARCYVRGVDINWKGVYPGHHPWTTLPPYPWQRERYWIDIDEGDPVMARSLDTTPLLPGKPVTSSIPPEARLWPATVSVKRYPYLADHRIAGRIVVPAAFFVEMALESHDAGESVVLEDIAFHTPLMLTGAERYDLQLVRTPDHGMSMASRLSDAPDEPRRWTQHVTGRSGLAGRHEASRFDPGRVSRAPDITGEAFYRQASDRGYGYGLAFQRLSALWVSDDAVVGRIDLADEARETATGYRLYPPVFDAGIQTALCLLPDDGKLYLPVSCFAMTCYHAPSGNGPFWVRAQRTPDGLTFHIDLFDPDGRALAGMRGARFEPVHAGQPYQDDNGLFVEQWMESTITTAAPSPARRFLLVAPSEGAEEAIRHALETAQPVIATIEVTNDLSTATDILFLAESSDSPQDDAGCARLLSIIQTLVNHPAEQTPRLWVITSAAQRVRPQEPAHPWRAPVWGLRRVAGLEHPELRPTMIDLPEQPDAADFAVLMDMLRSESETREWAIRDGRPYLRRLQPSRLDQAPWAERTSARWDGPYTLSAAPAGSLENLHFRGVEHKTPGPGQVALQPLATGLNFRDVMTALNLLPAEGAPGLPLLGWECVGRVIAAGAGVDHVQPGDRVWAIAPGCFASEVIADARLVRPLPTGMKIEDAATVPLAFLTAYYGLIVLGRLQPGERVLIHSASGGVGLAAVQIAQETGAEVFATAGNDEKRAYLTSLGAHHVMDSRTLTFADRIMEATGGRGVDVVLNSLAGEAMYRSLSVVAPYGRFVEIGKTDAMQHRSVDLNRFERNVSYHAVDLARMVVDRPDLAGGLFRTVCERAAKGDWKPLPCTVFPVQRTAEAFRMMAGARHTGKIVVTANEQPVPLRLDDRAPLFSADACYLVTGGLGGIGRLLTRWLIDQGGRFIVLTGRRAPGAEEAAWLDSLQGEDRDVRYVPVDAADFDGMQALFSGFGRDLPPLRGVFHCAGVADDGILMRYSAERLTQVMRPKTRGAWNLHLLTKDMDLDLFVLFSSLAATIALPGQSAYASANAFLNALAPYRRHSGLPAVSIAWGPWAGVGMASDQTVMERLGAQGFTGIEPERGLDLLDRILRRDIAGIAVLPHDPGRLRYAEHRRLLDTAGDGSPLSGDEETLPSLPALTAMPEARRAALVERFLMRAIGQVVEIDAREIDAGRTWQSLGVDSLMAVELRSRVEQALSVSVPVENFQAGTSIGASLREILQRMREGG